MEPIYMNELMNTIVLEVTAKQIFVIAIGVYIGVGITCLIHKIKGKK